jgi:hypothetical protein
MAIRELGMKAPMSENEKCLRPGGAPGAVGIISRDGRGGFVEECHLQMAPMLAAMPPVRQGVVQPPRVTLDRSFS